VAAPLTDPPELGDVSSAADDEVDDGARCGEFGSAFAFLLPFLVGTATSALPFRAFVVGS
jgi:hypothetical protein